MLQLWRHRLLMCMVLGADAATHSSTAATCNSTHTTDTKHAMCGDSCKESKKAQLCGWCKCKRCSFCGEDHRVGQQSATQPIALVRSSPGAAKSSTPVKQHGSHDAVKPMGFQPGLAKPTKPVRSGKGTAASSAVLTRMAKSHRTVEQASHRPHSSSRRPQPQPSPKLPREPTAEDSLKLTCYAINYPDLLQSYCQGNASVCYLLGLEWHWNNVGKQAGRSDTCRQPQELLRCYAQVRAVCTKDSVYVSISLLS